MVTEDLLERVPAARSYQSVVTSVPGVAVMGGGEVMNGDANMDAEFASRGPEPRQSAPKPMPDPTYMTDGAPVTDPVAGTFSLNFDYNNDEAERARFAPLDSREQNVSVTQDMTRAGVAMSQSEVACRRDGIDGTCVARPSRCCRCPSAPSAPPEPRRPQVSALPPEIPGKSGVSATTLAIPLPDHGAAIQVTQSLLSPGESATITVKYRESR
jgi:hypothetical protein